MQSGTGHDVDEERRDLVKAVENKGVAPHDDGHGVITIS